MKSKPYLLAFVTSLLFSGSFIAAKYTTQELKPLTTTLLRYIIALLFLTSLLLHYKWTSLKCHPKDLIYFLLLGLFGIVGYHYFFFLSLSETKVANTAIINAFSPILTGFFSALWLKERLTRKSYLGVFVAFIGVLFLLTQGKISILISLRFNRGDLFMLVSVLSWVFYALILKKLNYPSFTLTFYATLFGVLLLIVLTQYETNIVWNKISAITWYSLAYMGVGASGIGYLFYNASIQQIGPTTTSSIVYSIVPIGVAILAYLFFQQAITFKMIFSIIMIVFGLFLALNPQKNKLKNGEI